MALKGSFASRHASPGDLSPAFLWAEAIPCSLFIVKQVLAGANSPQSATPI
jgi:hypothetical protein